MASLYVEEFFGIGLAQAFDPPGTRVGQVAAAIAGGLQPSLSQTPVAITGSSTTSQVFQATTTLIRLHCDGICSVKIGGPNRVFGAPVATTSNMRLAANQTEYFAVAPGEQLAVIANV